jgi:hypothetical protein
MSAKNWQRTNNATFNAHLALFVDAGTPIKTKDMGDIIAYYYVGDKGETWVGKVNLFDKPEYYIALTDEA